jgi:vacuolar-type H+-ATPase subunit H
MFAKRPAGTVPLQEHLAALREADLRFHAERDRRYAEVAQARAEALKIKDEADREALRLSRESQTYKDERANNLRSQIERERGDYPTKSDLKAVEEKLGALIAPLAVFMASQQGAQRGSSATAGWVVGGVGVLTGLVSLVLRATGH